MVKEPGSNDYSTVATVSAIAKTGVIACLSLGLSSAQRPEFEVASVKPNTPNGPFDLTPRRSGDRIIMHSELGRWWRTRITSTRISPRRDLSLPDAGTGTTLTQGGGVAERR